MSNKNLQEILEDPSKKVTQTTNAMARLFRLILKENNIGYGQLSSNINRYLERQQTAVARGKKAQSRERGNLVKELSNDSLTFNNFIKGLHVLNPVSVELAVTIRWRRGAITRHAVEMNISNGSELENTNYETDTKEEEK